MAVEGLPGGKRERGDLPGPQPSVALHAAELDRLQPLRERRFRYHYPALVPVVALQDQDLAVDGVHHLLVIHHLVEHLGLDPGLLGQAHHLHDRADIPAGEAGIVAVSDLCHPRLVEAEAMASGYTIRGGRELGRKVMSYLFCSIAT